MLTDTVQTIDFFSSVCKHEPPTILGDYGYSLMSLINVDEELTSNMDTMSVKSTNLVMR